MKVKKSRFKVTREIVKLIATSNSRVVKIGNTLYKLKELG